MRPKTVKGAAKLQAAVVEVEAQRGEGLGAGGGHVGELAAARAGGRCRARGRSPGRGRGASAPAWRSRGPCRRGRSRRGRSPAGRRWPGCRRGRPRGGACRGGSRGRSGASCRRPRGATGRWASRLPAIAADSICTEGVTTWRPSGALERLSSQSAVTPRASAMRRSVSARGMRSIAGVEELAERRAVDAGVAEEAGDAAALVGEEEPAGARGRRRRSRACPCGFSRHCLWMRCIFRVIRTDLPLSHEINVIARGLVPRVDLARTDWFQTGNAARNPFAGTPGRACRVAYPCPSRSRPISAGARSRSSPPGSGRGSRFRSWRWFWRSIPRCSTRSSTGIRRRAARAERGAGLAGGRALHSVPAVPRPASRAPLRSAADRPARRSGVRTISIRRSGCASRGRCGWCWR